MTRRQPHEFTQYLLPEEAWLAPEATWETLRGADSTAWLAALWQTAHLYANTDAPPLPADGLYAEQSLVGTHQGVLITLPAPAEPGEAWFALLVRTPEGPAPFRYFMLESAADPTGSDAPGPTTIGERQADADRHHPRGPGPPAPTPTTAARFIVRVAGLLAETAESPLS